MAETAAIATQLFSQAIEPFVLIDCDSIFFPAGKFMSFASGCVSVFESSNPAHSFSQINESGFIDKVKEKEAISSWANTGHYLFPSVEVFLQAFDRAVKADETVNSEFYVAPLFNEIIKTHDIFGFRVAADDFVILGTPDDLSKAERKLNAI